MPARTAPPDFAARVDAIAAAVEAVPGVRSLHGGSPAEVAVYLPGRRVTGLRLDDTACAVHLALDWGADMRGIAQTVRSAVRPLVGDLPVEVVVEDVAAPPRFDATDEEQP